jgi:uncharacterized protein (DUF1697 family)
MAPSLKGVANLPPCAGAAWQGVRLASHLMFVERVAPALHDWGMALVVFLRGMNVGGHRRFRPRVLAERLNEYDVVNVGATGTFVVRKPGSLTKFRAVLKRELPFDAHVSICDGREIIRLATVDPFDGRPSRADIVRFVSVLPKASRVVNRFPIHLPTSDAWFVRVIGSRKQLVFGEYRRHMKTIGYLGQIDEIFGVPVTTRNWNTVRAIVRALEGVSQ